MITCIAHTNNGVKVKESVGNDENQLLEDLKNEYPNWSPQTVNAEFKFPDGKIASVSLEIDETTKKLVVRHWKPLLRYS